jgi:hypothetical protein
MPLKRATTTTPTSGQSFPRDVKKRPQSLCPDGVRSRLWDANAVGWTPHIGFRRRFCAHLAYLAVRLYGLTNSPTGRQTGWLHHSCGNRRPPAFEQ